MRLHPQEWRRHRIRRGGEAITTSAARHVDVDVVVDVVVVGGGPAGSAAAIRLARLGRSVVALERSGHDEPRLAEHLPPSVRPVLWDLGVIEPTRGRSNGVTMSWGDAAVRYSDYLFDPYGHGYHVDRSGLDADLAAVVTRTGGVVLRRTRAEPIARHSADCWTVTAVDSAGRTTRLTARFLVDATGRSAAVGRNRGSRRRRFDRLVGVGARCRLPTAGEGLGDRLVLESVEAGWWYAIALPTGQAAVVFMTDADAIRRHSSSTRHLWLREFARTTLVSALLPGLGDPPSVTVRSADTSILEPMHGAGWVAVGEAGVAFDPLSGCGVVDALESGSAAATAIDRALDGDTGALDVFAQQRVERFHRLLEQRREVYEWEQRWPTSPFWISRRLAPATASARAPQSGNDEASEGAPAAPRTLR